MLEAYGNLLAISSGRRHYKPMEMVVQVNIKIQSGWLLSLSSQPLYGIKMKQICCLTVALSHPELLDLVMFSRRKSFIYKGINKILVTFGAINFSSYLCPQKMFKV